ncbi:hemerythrin domain-containing protein [Nocardioides sp. W7]|uniref:hemerythrin domain-containing protein n=1 Tax=Nocardioides sp. W7 TaxID=2931390 RepID=UPI001FD0D5D7|nr:hemerythrin domain-containing protein [Nocardioides sp. W7]
MDAIAELNAEHAALVDEGTRLRAALSAGDRDTARDLLARLVEHLGGHVHREEQGIFTALRQHGEFADEVDALEGEHQDLDVAVAALDPDADGFDAAVRLLLADLEQHIEREDLGIFPVSVVTLGADGWDVVDRAHAAIPTFLPGIATPSPTSP